MTGQGRKGTEQGWKKTAVKQRPENTSKDKVKETQAFYIY